MQRTIKSSKFWKACGSTKLPLITDWQWFHRHLKECDDSLEVYNDRNISVMKWAVWRVHVKGRFSSVLWLITQDTAEGSDWTRLSVMIRPFSSKTNNTFETKVSVETGVKKKKPVILCLANSSDLLKQSSYRLQCGFSFTQIYTVLHLNYFTFLCISHPLSRKKGNYQGN